MVTLHLHIVQVYGLVSYPSYMYYMYLCVSVIDIIMSHSVCHVFFYFSCSGKVTSLNGHPLEGLQVMVSACIVQDADKVVKQVVNSVQIHA